MAKKIEVQGKEISIMSRDDSDYISLTDIARFRNTSEPFAVINNWMRSRGTIEFLGLWEKLSNPDFKLSNSRGLEMKREATILSSPRSAGSRLRMQKG